MSKKKNMKTVVASIAAVAMTFASLGTATYAWFTRGTEATATGFEFTASAASGIQISTDALDWKSNISSADFTAALGSGGVQEGNRLTINGMEPVSTVDTVTAGMFSFFNATSGDGNYTLAADTDNYLVFDLYFMNQGAEELTLSLTDDSSVVDGVVDNNTSLSTRVAFVVEGSSNDPAAVVTMATGSNTYIWEPNSLTRTTTALGSGAVDSAKYLYNGVENANGGVPVDTTDAYGFLAAGTYTDPVITTKDIAIGDSPVVATLPSAAIGQITKVKVFVWMEGQDVDCSNAISSGDVIIELGFDSSATTNTLETKTAASLATDVGTTTLTVTGTDRTATVYSAFVFEELTDAAISLDYRLFLSTGTATDLGAGVASIVLGTEVSTPATYQVVVIATLTSFVGTRTSTDIVVA